MADRAKRRRARKAVAGSYTPTERELLALLVEDLKLINAGVRAAKRAVQAAAEGLRRLSQGSQTR